MSFTKNMWRGAVEASCDSDTLSSAANSAEIFASKGSGARLALLNKSEILNYYWGRGWRSSLMLVLA